MSSTILLPPRRRAPPCIRYCSNKHRTVTRVRRPFGARGMSSVRYGTRLGDLKENWFLLFSNLTLNTHSVTLQRVGSFCSPAGTSAPVGSPVCSLCEPGTVASALGSATTHSTHRPMPRWIFVGVVKLEKYVPSSSSGVPSLLPRPVAAHDERSVSGGRVLHGRAPMRASVWTRRAGARRASISASFGCGGRSSERPAGPLQSR